MEASHEAPSFHCGECNTRFERKRNLIDHRRIHSLSYPHVCTECNRAFRLKSYLKKHSRSHTGERPYTCNICNFKFRVKSHLLDHKKKHSKVKPLICDVCNKGFRYKRNLIMHIRNHTTERSFICSLCTKKFTKKGCFLRHSLRCQPEEIFTPVGSSEQLNESFYVCGAEGHENSSPSEGFEVQGMHDLREEPSNEGIATNRTKYMRESHSCKGTDANGMIEPGSKSLQETTNRQMEDPGEGPSYCDNKDFQRIDNIEGNSYEEINTLGIEESRDSFSSWEENEIHRTENNEEGPYEDVIRGIEIRPSCERTNINRMEDPSQRPLPERTSIDHLQNTVAPASSPRKDPLSWEGISILGLEYPGENVSLEETGPREIQDPGEGPSSCGMIRTNIGGEADLHQSVHLPWDMVPKAVNSSASLTSEGVTEQSSEECFSLQLLWQTFLCDVKKHRMGHVQCPLLLCNVIQRESKPNNNYTRGSS